jgi:hypothetical protein
VDVPDRVIERMASVRPRRRRKRHRIALEIVEPCEDRHRGYLMTINHEEAIRVVQGVRLLRARSVGCDDRVAIVRAPAAVRTLRQRSAASVNVGLARVEWSLNRQTGAMTMSVPSSRSAPWRADAVACTTGSTDSATTPPQTNGSPAALPHLEASLSSGKDAVVNVVKSVLPAVVNVVVDTGAGREVRGSSCARTASS